MVDFEKKNKVGSKTALKKHRPSLFARGQAIRTRSRKTKYGRFVFKSNMHYMYALFFSSVDIHSLQRSLVNFREYRGVAFMIPFIFSYILVSLPLMWTQIFLGYYAKVGILNFSRLAPISSGVGYTMLILTYIRVVSKSRLCSIALTHIYYALHSKVPWNDCSFVKDGRPCVVDGGNNITESLSKVNCCSGELNLFGLCPREKYQAVPHAAHVWNKLHFFDSNFSIVKDGMGEFEFGIFLGIIITWVIMFLVLQRRIVVLNKILVPVIIGVLVLLVVMIVWVLFSRHDPSLKGIKFYFEMEILAFSYKDLWASCLEKALENLHLIYGTAVTFSSLAPEHTNTHSTTIVVGVSRLMTTIFFIFLYIRLDGIVCAMLQVPNTCIFGTEWNHFYSCPSYLFASWKYSNVWNIIFFLVFYLIDFIYMMLMMFALLEAILDAYPRLQEFYTYFVLGLCVLACGLALPLCFKASQIINHNLGQHILLSVGVFALLVYAVVVMWIYGVVRLSDDIHFFTVKQPTKFWTTTWYFIPAVMMIFLVIPAVFDIYTTNDAGSTLLLPFYIGLAILIFCPIPILATYTCIVYFKEKSFFQVFLPTSAWGPTDKEDRRLRYHFNPRRIVRFRIDTPLKHYPPGLLNRKQLKLENDRLEAHRKIFLEYMRNKQEELGTVSPGDDSSTVSEDTL